MPQASCYTGTDFEPKPVSGSSSYMEVRLGRSGRLKSYLIALTWFWEIGPMGKSEKVGALVSRNTGMWEVGSPLGIQLP